MKINSSGYVFNWLTSLIMAIVIVILAATTTAKAQNNLDIRAIEGLFTPTQSQRFYQEGRENFAQEIRIFQRPERYLEGDILQIDPELSQQMNQKGQAANFEPENAQYQLYSDR